jgi:pyrimidine and pyridine-specific 5'-nucleotidase
VILHLKWSEDGGQQQSIDEMSKVSETSVSLFPPPSSLSTSRTRTLSSLSRSTSSISTPPRRTIQAASTPLAKTRLSLNSTVPRTPGTPLSPSSRSGTPLTSAFPIRFGRAAVLTAPPTLVAVIDTPDLVVGAVDPSKRRVVTATRFSSRIGADRTVSFYYNRTCWLMQFMLLGIYIHPS